jgi:gliding motility-associated-like protein
MLNYSNCDSLEDGSDTNGVAIFDFSDATREILNLFPGENDLQVYYYPSYENAVTETLEIDPTRFINAGSPFSQKIWVRVEGSSDNSCIGLGQHLTLFVNEVPRFEVFQEEVVCQSQFPYTIEARNVPENFTYEWSDEEGNILGSERQFNAPGEGTFTVTVSKTDGTYCSTSKTVTLGSILPPVITGIDVEGIITLQSAATVVLDNQEGFEFSLDDPGGPYQDSNVFEEVAPGIHRVYVRDKNHCELVDREFSVIGHPAFFTPNNDGVNDFWQIQGVSAELQAESLIYIYDRYGTLLGMVDPGTKGWDGSYNGKLLPSSDYWFRVILEDGKEFNGHFALVR